MYTSVGSLTQLLQQRRPGYQCLASLAAQCVLRVTKLGTALCQLGINKVPQYFKQNCLAVLMLSVVVATFSGSSAGTPRFSMWPLSACGVSSSRASPPGLSPAGQPGLPHNMAAGIQGAFQENRLHPVSTYQASACITLAKASLAKSSHMIKLSFNAGGDFTRACIPEVYSLGRPQCNSLPHQY